MNLTIHNRRPQLKAIGLTGDVEAVWQGCGQAELHADRPLVGSSIAVRIDGMVYIPCTDPNRLAELNYEWETGKPSNADEAKRDLLRHVKKLHPETVIVEVQ